MKRFPTVLAILAMMLIGGFQTRGQQQSARKFVPVTDAMLEKPDPANWLMWRRTQDGWGYSPLNQINRNNVAQLRMVWTRGMAEGTSQESTPLVYDGVMYLPNSGDYIQALDAKDRRPDLGLSAQARRDSRRGTNRNIAIYGNLIIDTSMDNAVYALDAQTGKLAWETQILDPKKPANASSGPIIANGKIISGRQCQPGATYEGCIITAHDAKTGKELWRTSTIPKPGEPGDETWGGVPMEQRWHVGTWMVPSYDPRTESDLRRNFRDDTRAEIHSRRQQQQAPLSQLHTGAERRHRKDRVVLPAHRRSLGSGSSVRTHSRGHRGRAQCARRVVDQSEGQGRRTAQGDHGNSRQDRRRLHARSPDRRVPLGAADGLSERHQQNRRQHRRSDGQRRSHVFAESIRAVFVCPGSTGGKNWPAGAYSPLTNMMYFPLQNLCNTATTTTDQRDPSKVYGLTMVQQLAPRHR